MIEVGGVAIMDARDIDASSLELVDKCLVVIGTHTGPAGITDLMIEYCY